MVPGTLYRPLRCGAAGLPNIMQTASVTRPNLKPQREGNSGKCISSLVKLEQYKIITVHLSLKWDQLSASNMV